MSGEQPEELTCIDCGGPRTRYSKSGRCRPCADKLKGPKAPVVNTERDRYPLCGAKKRSDGLPCRQLAGLGTGHPGIGPCKHHGGSTKNHRKRAALIQAKQQMITLGAPLDVNADQALRGVLRATAGHVAWLAAEVAALSGLHDPGAPTLVNLYGEERDRLARVAKACQESGMTKREVEFEQKQTARLAEAVDSAFRSVPGLTAEQRKSFGRNLRLELALLAKSAKEPEVAEPFESAGQEKVQS